MKLNIKGLVFVGFAAAVFASAANATEGDNKKVTSYQFTEATYQKKLTADSPISISADNHISTTAEANVIEGVTVNGNATTVTNKIADVNAITGVKTSAGETLTPTNGVVTLPANTVDTNTTYTFASGDTPKAFQVTDSATNTAQTVQINGLGTASTADVSTTGVAADENDLVTGAQVAAYVGTQVDSIDQYSAGDNVTFGTAVNGVIPINADDTTYTVAPSSTNGSITVTPSVGSAYDVAVPGLAAAAYKPVDSSISAGSTSTNLPTTAAVAAYVDGLIPAAPTTGEGACSTANPCALVSDGATVTWQRIQQ